jgi:MFS family permease
MKVHEKREYLYILFVFSTSLFIAGYEVGILPWGIIYMKETFYPYLTNPTNDTLFLGSILLGYLIGPMFSGIMTDIFGRKKMYIYNLIFLLIFGILSITFEIFYLNLIFRILFGFFLGAEFPISNSYVAEYAKPEIRGRYLAFLNVVYTIGATLGVLISFIIPLILPPEPYGWRILIGIGLIPAPFAIYFRYNIQESEKWKNLGGKTYGIEIVKSMFTGKGGKFTILNSINWFLFDMVAYGTSLFLPYIIYRMGRQILYLTNEELLISFSIGILVIIISIIAMYLVDIVGRKIIQIIGSIGISMILITLPFWVKESIFILIFFIFVAEIFVQFVSTTVGIFPAELAKTEYRGSAYGFSVMMGKIGSLLGLVIIGSSDLNSVVSLQRMQYFGIASLLIAIITLFLVDFTKMNLDKALEIKENL